MKNILILSISLASCFVSIGQNFQSKYGYSLPVAGDNVQTTIKVMVVFAERVGDCANFNDASGKNWTPGSLPTNADNYFDASYSGNPSAYITKYFHEMSYGNYIVLGDYLDHVVTIDCADFVEGEDGTNGTSNVMEHLGALIDNNQMTFQNGSSLSEFDQWMIVAGTSGEDIFVKRSKPEVSNSRIDVLLILWRNGTWTGLGGEGLGPAEKTTLIGSGIGNNSFIGCDNKAAFGVGQSGLDGIKFVISEYFHAMFGRNNFHLASGHGKHTFPIAPAGVHSIGSQVQAGGSSNVVSGWDRNHLDWYGWQDDDLTVQKNYLISALDNSRNEIETDLSLSTNNSVREFILRDFVTTGDAIRIKLPHINWQTLDDTKNQYLWFENHQKLSIFDVSTYEHLSCSDPWSTGIYSYVQVGKDVKATVGEVEVWNSIDAEQPNSLGCWLRPLNAEGNWDFKYRRDLVSQINPTPNQQCIWGNKTIPIDYSQSIENSFTGMCDQYNYYSWDGPYLKTHLPDQNLHPYQPGGSEVIDGNVVFNAHRLGDSEDAFSPITKYHTISMSTNPSPVPVYTFRTNSNGLINTFTTQTELGYENRTIWLNGLKIEFLEQMWNDVLRAYDIKVRITWDAYDIENDVRWCGNIKLSPNDFNSSDYSLNLKSNNSILLNRGLSPNKHISTVQIDGRYIFSDPTVFTCLPNSYFHMEPNSSVRVEGLATDFVLKAGSRLEIHDGAEFIVGPGGRLIVQDGAEITIHDGGKLIIEEFGEMIYENTNVSNPIQIGTIGSTGTQAEWRIDGKLTIKDNTVLDIDGNGYIHFMDDYELEFQGNSYVGLSGEDINKKLIEVDQYTTLTMNDAEFAVSNGKIINNGNIELFNNLTNFSRASIHGEILVDGGYIRVFDSKISGALTVQNMVGSPYFELTEIYNSALGLHIINCNTVNILNCNIHHNGSSSAHGTKIGVKANNVTTLNFYDCNVESNDVGLQILNSTTVRVNGSTFYANDIGVKAIYTQAIYFNDTRLYLNGLGLRADYTEVYLRNGTIFDTNIGQAITMQGSSDLTDAMLTIGDVGCGNIVNNYTDPAVITHNVILNIDATIHQGNTGTLEPNSFNDNQGVVFEVCYEGVTALPLPIMAQGNFWGTIGNVSFGLNNGNVADFFNIKPCSGSVNVNYTVGGVDALNHSTCIPTGTCEDCSGASSGNGNGAGSGGAFSVGVINGGGVLAVDCKKKVKENYAKTIGEEYLAAHQVFTPKDTLPNRAMYRELSKIELDKTTKGWRYCHQDDYCEQGNGNGGNDNDRIVKDRCAQLIFVSKVIIDKNPAISARIANPSGGRGYNDLEPELSKSSDSQIEDISSFKVFPNPNSGVFTIEVGKEFRNKDLTVKVYDVVGKEVLSVSLNTESNKTITLSDDKLGVYFILVYDESGMLLGKDKVVVEY